MTKTDTQKTETKPQSVVARLQAHKAARSGNGSFILPETGVEVTFPKFIKHGNWMRAERLAKGDAPKAKSIYLQEVCRFDGEKLTLDEFSDLLPTGDVMELLGEVLGGEDDDLGDNANTEGVLGKA